MMMSDEWCDPQTLEDQDQDSDSYLNFDFFSLLTNPKDYYKILEVDNDATEEAIRSNYIRLALKWHPDKQKDQDSSTSRFQDINEAYHVGHICLWNGLQDFFSIHLSCLKFGAVVVLCK